MAQQNSINNRSSTLLVDNALTVTAGGAAITGNTTINITGSGTTAIGTGSNSGTLSLGNSSSAAVSIDCGTAGITVGTTANAHTSTFGSTNTTSATTIQSGSGALNVTSANGALTINSGTGALGISNDAAATTISLGTGTGVKTITLGSTNTTSVTNLQSGSGGIKIPAFAEGALVTSSTGVISTVTGTAGYILTANTAGTAPSFQVALPSGIAWSVITADQTAAVNNAYICNKAGLLTLTLPTTAAAGTIIGIAGMNTALGWKIAQNSSQQIFFGTSTTTSGTGGSLASAAIYDSVQMVCNVANTSWIVLSSIGNITVV